MINRGNCVILNANQIVTCHGYKGKTKEEMNQLSVLHNGNIVIKDGIITKVTDNDIDLEYYKRKNYEIIDASGKCVLPGFVDSHTHFVFGGYRENEYNWRLQGEDYMTIMNKGGGIINTVKATEEASKDSLIESGIRRLNRMLTFGVTTVEGKSGYGLDYDTEMKQLEVMKHLNKVSSMDIVTTFLGPHARPSAYKENPDAFIDFMIDEVLPEVDKKGLAEFADIFCEENVFSIDQSRKFLLAAQKRGFKLKIHADEIVRLGGAELAADLGAISADHLLQASDEGIEKCAASGTVTSILPLTAFSLNEPFANARKMIDSGCVVALASDFNPGSCFSESIPLLIALATNKMHMTVEETITALTINGAAALDRADQIGSIDIGKKGDLVIHEFPTYEFLSYHFGVSTVEKVIKNGRIVVDKYISEAL